MFGAMPAHARYASPRSEALRGANPGPQPVETPASLFRQYAKAGRERTPPPHQQPLPGQPRPSRFPGNAQLPPQRSPPLKERGRGTFSPPIAPPSTKASNADARIISDEETAPSTASSYISVEARDGVLPPSPPSISMRVEPGRIRGQTPPRVHPPYQSREAPTLPSRIQWAGREPEQPPKAPQTPSTPHTPGCLAGDRRGHPARCRARN